MTTQVFSGNGYRVEQTKDGQFLLTHPVGVDETYDSFEELVEDHPICEVSRDFFFENEAQ